MDDIKICFNEIYVIQSLPDDEEPTGQRLYENIIRPKITDLGLEQDVRSEFISVYNKEELIISLNRIADRAEYDISHPYLHFEMHGDDDGDGLVVASNNLITWEELRPLLTNINIKTKNNLFVSVATCLGSHIFKSVDLFAGTPFSGYVGFPDDIYPEQLETDWSNYFSVLLETLDFQTAVDALNASNPEANYVFETAIELFNNYSSAAYKHYNKTSSFWNNHPELESQIRDYINLMHSLTGSTISEETMKETYTRMRATKAGIHDKLRNKFLMKTTPSIDNGSDYIF